MATRIFLFVLSAILLVGAGFLARDSRRQDEPALEFAAWGAAAIALVLICYAIVNPVHSTKLGYRINLAPGIVQSAR